MCLKCIKDLHIVLIDHLQKIMKKYRSLKKQEIHDIFIKTSWIKLVFNIWFKEILKMKLEESDKNCDKAFDISKNPKYDGCQRGLASMVYTWLKNLLRVQIHLLPVVVLKKRIFQTKN